MIGNIITPPQIVVPKFKPPADLGPHAQDVWTPSPTPPEGPDQNRSDKLEQLLKDQPDLASDKSLWGMAKDQVYSLFVPKNVDSAMTKDYVPTRWWWLGREMMGSMSYGFAAGQATSIAMELLVKSQPGLAAATIGLGLGMYWFPKVVEQMRNLTSMSTSKVAEVADRRPKAWYLAGDIVDNLGTGALSCAALVPPLYAPLTIGVGLTQTVAGVLKGRAGANMGYRQAKNPQDTLPDVNTKHGNQSIALNLVSMLAGAGLQWAVGGTALAWSLPIVGCATAGLAIYCTARYLANLDMENVNESVIRQAVEKLDKGEALAAPEGHRVWKSLGTLLERDTIPLGQDPTRLKQAGAARYQQLRETYKDQRYLLESFKGQPYIVLKEGAEKRDAVTAVVQAIHMERLAASPEYQQMVESKGSDGADYWLVEQSLAKAREQGPTLLDKLKEKGWATDLVNFLDTDKRYSEEELNKPLPEGMVALP